MKKKELYQKGNEKPKLFVCLFAFTSCEGSNIYLFCRLTCLVAGHGFAYEYRSVWVVRDQRWELYLDLIFIPSLSTFLSIDLHFRSGLFKTARTWTWGVYTV